VKFKLPHLPGHFIGGRFSRCCVLVKNIQNGLAPTCRTCLIRHARSRKGGFQLSSCLGFDDNRDVHAAKEIQVVRTIPQSHGYNGFEGRAVIVGEKADAVGFVAIASDVMEASAAGPFFPAAFDGLQEFVSGRIKDFEGFVIFPDLRQSGLLKGKAVFPAYLLGTQIAEPTNSATGFPGGLPKCFDEIIIGNAELEDSIGIASIRRAETGREVSVGNIQSAAILNNERVRVAESCAPVFDFSTSLAGAEHEREAQLVYPAQGLPGRIHGICGLIKEGAIEVCEQDDHDLKIAMWPPGVDPTEAVLLSRKDTTE
jgi:hypothetical protein